MVYQAVWTLIGGSQPRRPAPLHRALFTYSSLQGPFVVCRRTTVNNLPALVLLSLTSCHSEGISALPCFETPRENVWCHSPNGSVQPPRRWQHDVRCLGNWRGTVDCYIDWMWSLTEHTHTHSRLGFVSLKLWRSRCSNSISTHYCHNDYDVLQPGAKHSGVDPFFSSH